MSYANAGHMLTWFGAKELAEVAVPDDHSAVSGELMRLTIEGGDRSGYPAEEIVSADLALQRILAVIEEGGRMLESYLAHRYPLPLDEATIVASPLPRVCSVLALTLLYDDQLPVSVDQRQQRTLSWLHDLAAGRVELAPLVSRSGRVVGGPDYETVNRVFDTNTLQGFV